MSVGYHCLTVRPWGAAVCLTVRPWCAAVCLTVRPWGAAADSSLEAQMELLALQQLAFLYTICHVVLVVQDWCVDSDLIR